MKVRHRVDFPEEAGPSSRILRDSSVVIVRVSKG